MPRCNRTERRSGPVRRSARLAKTTAPVDSRESCESCESCQSPSINDNLCIACQDQPRAVRCRPCGHGVLCGLCTVKHIGSTVGDGSAPYRCVICRESVGMVEWQGSAKRRRSSIGFPTAVKQSEPPRGEVLGVVAFLRARAKDLRDAPLADEAARVLRAKGTAVSAPVRGSLFATQDEPGTPATQQQNDEDEEYLRMEDAITDMWRSPIVTDIRQISEFIGATPDHWLASPTAEAA